jgi:hypothetical protein
MLLVFAALVYRHCTVNWHDSCQALTFAAARHTVLTGMFVEVITKETSVQNVVHIEAHNASVNGVHLV